MIEKTLTFVLAGGTGSRLYPLTNDRAKPAVPFGGKYRIIDFALANCLHSGLRRILVLTQYKSHSLYKHLRDGWSIFNPELGEYITPVPPQMRSGETWYQGTADAIWQNRYLLERSGAEYVAILSGDHIYRMDYAAMLHEHSRKTADVTIACMKVNTEEAKHFGVVTTDQEGTISHFVEKPEKPEDMVKNDPEVLVSMGVYIFNRKVLLDSLQQDSSNQSSSRDFGKDIIPELIKKLKVCAYHFGGNSGRVSQDKYWRDVGTLDSYYEASMNLIAPMPSLDLYQENWPIRSYQAQTPPARTVPSFRNNEGIFINSILGGGAIISGGCVQESIIFPKVYVGDESVVEKSILFEEVKIGNNVEIKNCIIDKNVIVPDNVKIGFDKEIDKKYFTISDNGIVVVPKGFDFRDYLAS